MKDLLTAKEVLARLLRSKEEQYGFVSSSSRSFVLRSSSDSSCSPLLPPLLLSLSSLFSFLELSLPSPLFKNYFGNFVLSLSGPIGYSVLCLLRSRERLVILYFHFSSFSSCLLLVLGSPVIVIAVIVYWSLDSICISCSYYFCTKRFFSPGDSSLGIFSPRYFFLG